ncbi:MAG TPA: [FeFe] hydrogenase H-cluster radical SAM maturase HydE [bacterium]|nr:[FeFe] hydrogenase H-cluster radical SAM maturase HydE [bacterium]HPJ72397.1 [FeFe] hydrogenase H-cluster radical SAM maturase HydE [bacterium]HPQ65514.1 [FeFe] hydrogenase H-cluster radical SAM maturase HydE [bacterium]
MPDCKPDNESRERARETTRAVFGDTVFLRALIEISSHCSRDCLYCGLRRSHRRLARYRMARDEVLVAARAALQAGLRTVVLQAGDDPGLGRGEVCDLIRGIKALEPEAAVTLSLGERPRRDYRAFREAGADRYLLKFETSDPGLYRRLRPGRELRERLDVLALLADLGYEVGTGNIVGLPGQERGSLERDLELLAEIAPEMVGTGPFLPQSRTPLGDAPPGDPEQALDFLAAVRLALPRANIPATTALGSLGENYPVEALRTAANVLMVGFTPAAVRDGYAIYDRRARFSPARAGNAARAAGKRASGERGDSPARRTA